METGKIGNFTGNFSSTNPGKLKKDNTHQIDTNDYVNISRSPDTHLDRAKKTRILMQNFGADRNQDLREKTLADSLADAEFTPEIIGGALTGLGAPLVIASIAGTLGTFTVNHIAKAFG
ncbi:MAG: hypothetical protein ACLFQV_07965 [Vulcanimicrobiota bacterium]